MCEKYFKMCIMCLYESQPTVLDKMSNIEPLLYRLFLFVKYFYFKILNKHLGLGWFHTYRKRITKTPITTTLTLLYSKQCIHTAIYYQRVTLIGHKQNCIQFSDLHFTQNPVFDTEPFPVSSIPTILIFYVFHNSTF